MTKSVLLVPFLAIIFFTQCSVTKKIQKSDTNQESQTKVDSSSVVRKNQITESKIESTVTETIDTTVFISPAGELITDSARVVPASIPVKVKKKKVTKTHAEIKEVDKTHAKTELKKSAQQETKVVTVNKDIKKSGFPWWSWLVLLLVLAAYLFYRFYLKRFL